MMQCAMFHNVLLPYQMGKPLQPIKLKCFHTMSQSEEGNQVDQALFIRMTWQLILILTGESSCETGVLKGKAFDREDQKMNPIHNTWLKMLVSELLIFFGDFEQAAKAAIERGDEFQKEFPALVTGMMEKFHRGVALYAMARKTKKRIYKKHGNKRDMWNHVDMD